MGGRIKAAFVVYMSSGLQIKIFSETLNTASGMLGEIKDVADHNNGWYQSDDNDRMIRAVEIIAIRQVTNRAKS